MKLRVAWRNIVHYIRTDLKEIAFPSSLPDPPSSKPKPRKLTVRDHYQVWTTATRLYVRSWRTGTLDDEEDEDKSASKKAEKSGPEEYTVLEEIAVAARKGSEHLRPALQNIYITRMSAYRDALKSFVQGYQEGIGEVMGAMKYQVEKGDSQSSRPNHQPYTAPQEDPQREKEERV